MLSWSLSVAAMAALGSSMIIRRLHQSWPWFTAWVVLSLIGSLVLMALATPLTERYFRIYLVREPFLLVLITVAVLEVFRRRCAYYHSIGRVGEWLLGGGLLLATVATLVTFLLSEMGQWHAFLEALVTLRFAVFSILLLFTLISLCFFWHYHVTASSNAIWHHRMMLVYLAIQAVSIGSAYLLGQKIIASVNKATLPATVACYIVWIAVLRKGGDRVETQPVSVPADELEATTERWIRGLGSLR